ncbi:DUF4976 domain-containing protein [Balneolaceae bacterium YR4-1]|uniref:DUF4976 domain-containing protein n=2 Tax=Halalkalibaculum roseum TaxID=2709311 RepID=A0A6M1T3P9_9BACT|nr:DUF4976 domain-containing protein [Halalkalibaculum roseum]
MIISAPGVESNIKVDSPTEFVDLFPTLTDLSNIETPQSLDGKSLVPVMNGDKERVKDFAISQYRRGKHRMGYALRNDRYRYVEWHKNDYRSYKPYKNRNIVARELYDYKKDPLESINVVESEDYQDTAKKLKKQLKDFLTEKSPKN